MIRFFMMAIFFMTFLPMYSMEQQKSITIEPNSYNEYYICSEKRVKRIEKIKKPYQHLTHKFLINLAQDSKKPTEFYVTTVDWNTNKILICKMDCEKYKDNITLDFFQTIDEFSTWWFEKFIVDENNQQSTIGSINDLNRYDFYQKETDIDAFNTPFYLDCLYKQ